MGTILATGVTMPDRKRKEASHTSFNGRLVLAGLGTCVGLATGFAAGRWGLLTATLVLGVVAVLVLWSLWNTLPPRRTPAGRRAAPDPVRVRWPEALPLRSFHGNDRLLFCVHGFPSTPADFRRLEEASNARGWDMAAPLLPGCGTEPDDILCTGWDDYLAVVRDWWSELRPRYRSACLVGTSMGGSLCLALAEETCETEALSPAAMATIGTPVVLNAMLRHGILKNPLLYHARALGAIIPTIGVGFPDREGEDGDGSWKGYVGIFTRQSYSLQANLRRVERELGKVTCPILVCQARGDRIVPFENAAVIERGVGSDVIEAYVANMDAFGHARHNLVLYDSQRDRVWARILDFLEANGG